MADDLEQGLMALAQQAARETLIEDRQRDRLMAIGLAASLQLLEGLGLTIIEEVRRGHTVIDALANAFGVALKAVDHGFEKACQDYQDKKAEDE